MRKIRAERGQIDKVLHTDCESEVHYRAEPAELSVVQVKVSHYGDGSRGQHPMIKTYQEVQAENQDVERVQLVGCLFTAIRRLWLLF